MAGERPSSSGWIAEAVDRHGEHLVVADEQAQLDELDVRAAARAARPRGRRRSCGRRAARRRRAAARPRARPARRVRALGDAGHLGRAEARPPREVLVVALLVRARAVRRDAEDDQLGVAPRQPAARHERAGEPQPAPEEPPVTGEGREQVRRLRACRRARPMADVSSALTRPISSARAGRDARLAAAGSTRRTFTRRHRRGARGRRARASRPTRSSTGVAQAVQLVDARPTRRGR